MARAMVRRCFCPPDRLAALRHRCLQAVFRLADELPRLCNLTRLDHLVLIGVSVAPAKVVRNGAADQRGFLRYDANQVTERVQLVLPHVLAVQLHAALGDVIEAGNQINNGTLAAAGTADDAQRFTGIQRKADVVQCRFAAVRIGKGDVVESQHRNLFTADMTSSGTCSFSVAVRLPLRISGSSARTSEIRLADAAALLKETSNSAIRTMESAICVI